MKQSTTAGLWLICSLIALVGQAQNIAGFWLGVTYPADPNQAVYNYTMTLTQTGNSLGGTSQTANPNAPFGGIAYLSGQVSLPAVTFGEADKTGSTTVNGICFWQGKLTYNATDESLIGTYGNITNGTTCKDQGSGKVELYRIVVKSGTSYCKGSPINLVITGKNIKWYASPTSTTPLASGNTFSPAITQTTTFYVTQTLYRTESPPIPITIDITEPTFTTSLTHPGCDRASGSIALIATGSSGWQYSLNDGTFQTAPLFGSLGPGTYRVKAKNSAGCQREQSVTLMTVSGPLIDNLKLTPPVCGSANGEVNVIASRGKTPFAYSIDYGVTFQTSSVFSKLASGTYTFRVRDANGCEVNGALTVPSSSPMTILGTTGLPTTCGKANGEITMTTATNNTPVQYSLDNQTFQQGNTFVGLKAGAHTVLARDNAGCLISQTISVAASTSPQLTDVQTRTEGCGQKNGAIFIADKQSSDVVTYSIDGRTFQGEPTFSGLKAGNYTLIAEDTNNCAVTQLVLVPVDCAGYIHLPTAFSPNADHINDNLTVHFAFGTLSVSKFTIYDRWGAVLYSRANFELTNGDSVWDGQVNGHSIPSGVYVYRLDCQFPDGTQSSFRESVALLNE